MSKETRTLVRVFGSRIADVMLRRSSETMRVSVRPSIARRRSDSATLRAVFQPLLTKWRRLETLVLLCGRPWREARRSCRKKRIVVGRGCVEPVYVSPMGALGRDVAGCEGLRKADGWKKSWSDDL